MTIETIQLDWRGMRCPEPILKTARKVRKLRDGTDRRIQIYADDDAFPMDIKSWCQSAGITLMGVEERDGYYEAILQLDQANTKAPTKRSDAIRVMRETIDTEPPRMPTQPTTISVTSEGQTLDCTGMACPEPILKLARAYRKLGDGGTLTITADDDAFPIDLKSWLKSSGGTLVDIQESTLPFSATISKPSKEKPVPTPVAQSTRVASTSHTTAPIAVSSATHSAPTTSHSALRLDLEGLTWEAALARLESMTAPAWGGETLEVRTTHTGHLQQIVSWLTSAGHQLVKFDAAQGVILLGVSAHATGAVATSSSQALVPINTKKRATFLVIHNDFESLMAALMVANTTAAQDIETSIFFSFWGVNLLRSDRPRHNVPKKPMTIIHRMFRWMMPIGPGRQPLSKMHFGGAGKAMMLASMRQQNVMDLESLMESAIESGVRFTVCTMSMSIMGIQKRDIMERDNIDFAGVASFVTDSADSDISMVF